ncbi:hypothetical protein LJR066_002845 [Acidovorax sp. LjRoot66]|uniref:hypothetical protein n=1 Tax=Acidovorax sp. LjRoot66 TaxID=3342334 RepID=UPI003ECFFB13
MLLYKDLNGQGDGKENTILNGMLRTGNEFITERDADSEVQVSGEFASMRRIPTGETLQLCALFELADARSVDEAGNTTVLADNVDRSGGYKPFTRTRLFDGFFDETGGTRGPDLVSGKRQNVRQPRFTKLPERVHDVDHTTQAGRGRFWHLGDGESLLVVRENFTESDPRYFMGVTAAGFTTRRTRLSSVDLVRVVGETGKVRDTLLSFDTFSGLGFDPGTRAIQVVDGTGSEALFDASNVFTGRAGHTWGRYTNAGLRMDPSATYAVAEPAWHPDGFLSLVVVHARPSDNPNPQSSIIRTLTCTRTRKSDEPATSTISLPAHGDEKNDWSVCEVELLRVSPTALLLRVLMAGVLKPGTQLGGTQGGNAYAFYWSADSGITWGLLDLSSIEFHLTILQRPTGMMATGTGKALLFTSGTDLAEARDTAMVVVHELTAAGPSTIGTINGSVFSAGLDEGNLISGVRYYPKYYPVGFGGGVRIRVGEVPVQRLWMQFDPFAVQAEGNPGSLAYPNARPMLMVSDDGGVTWSRRFLPVEWQQRAGFTVSWDQTTMLVPVSAPRRVDDEGYLQPVSFKLHESKDGGTTWKAKTFRFTLPWQANTDGQLLPDEPEYDIDDFRFDYNRGELFPLVAVRGPRGDVLPMNPGRPWIADARKEAP